MNEGHQKHVVVIGAGVIGLQTAVFLLEADYKVTVIAKHLPGDLSPEYTSPWAGAQWRTHATTDQPEQCQWDLETYRYWQEMIEKEAADRANRKTVLNSGIGVMAHPKHFPNHKSAYIPYLMNILYISSTADAFTIQIFESLNYWTDPRPLTTAPEKHLWFLPHVIAPTTLPTTSLPSGVSYGIAYTTFCLDPTVYLDNLQRNILSFPKASILRHTLSTNNGLAHAIKTAQGDQSLRLGKVDIWINATGLGSKALVPDDGMFPTRGQTSLVKGQARKAITWVRENGGVSYVIPRPGSGGTILGGCKQDDNWDQTVDEDLAKQILGNCKALAPELLDEKGEFEVVSQQVGFRPSRCGGARVEGEEVDGGVVVVHCYGHAGGG
ncbi:MAG: hypothetical protein M1835_005569 [Candelina submexicana]|nr:MAG: hypothetical protein M1835_005569 [Candelina submexicana]